mmetsp:Transcript_21873/g.33676  ORF Transcript_21873/g.33676 Transcript_21873/m.33676 type:complete len:434 (+) Transcript_21873:61-1362(+)
MNPWSPPKQDGKAKMLKLGNYINRSDVMQKSGPPGSPASNYFSCIDQGKEIDFVSLVADETTNPWLLFAILSENALLLMEFADLDVKRKCYKEEAFLDRGVRRLIADGARLAVVSLNTAENWLKKQTTIYERLGAGGANTSWVGNTGRCGSTLLHKVLSTSTEMCSLSEPHYIDQLTHGRILMNDDDKFARVVQICCALDWELARRSCFPNAIFFSMNPKSGGTKAQLAFHTAFPQSKHFFMYRAAHKVIESFGSIHKAQGSQPSLLWSTFTSLAWNGLGLGMPHIPPRFTSDLRSTLFSLSSAPVAFLTARWFDAVLGYLQEVKPAIPNTLVIRMDEFVNPVIRAQVVKAILDHLNMDKNNLQDCIDAFDQDSQAGSSMSRRKGDMPKFLTESDRKHIQDVCLVTAFSDMSDLVALDGESILIYDSLAATKD